MSGWIGLLVLIISLVGTLISAAPTRADHNDDLHSPNMVQIANSPRSGTVNSDLAFWGDLAFAGNYRSFRILDIRSPRNPEVIAEKSCNGAQGDVSVWEDLLFISVDSPQDRRYCKGSVDMPGGFEGIRIIDVSRPKTPRFVKGVATDCGSHTHTLVPDLDNNRVLLYISSYPGACPVPHNKISVIEVPLDNPKSAHVISEPPVPTTGCHDITVLMPLQLAAASCLSEAQLWDISDPVNPTVETRIDNPSVAFWHSATFSWDGKYVYFGDEYSGGLGCAPGQAFGRLWVHEVADPQDPVGSFMIPRPQTGGGLCTVHNFITVPVTDYYLVIAAWYTGGTTVVDFTRPAKPREIGFYDAVESPGPSNAWSSYWYNGYIYANDIGRGVDIFRLRSAKTSGARIFPHLNPQTHEVLIRR